MYTITITQGAKVQSLSFAAPILLSSLLQPLHLPLNYPCAGHGRCKQCKVKAGGELSPPTAQELAALTPTELAEGVRLACLTTALGDVSLQLLRDNTLRKIATQGSMPKFTHAPWATGYGAAIDIGTTTVVARLYNLQTAQLLDTIAGGNPQSSYGADVISRMQYTLNNTEEPLFYTISTMLHRMLHSLLQGQNISPKELGAVVITGNTVMLHFLTRHNIKPLTHAPFAAQQLFGQLVNPQDIGLAAFAKAQVYLTPCVAAFVGGDITTALIGAELTPKNGNQLLIDIGTNGEIILAGPTGLWGCSTAAGPAFEGAGISAGVNAIPGGVDSLRFTEGDLHYTTIDNKPAVGICGSGLLDALAALLQAGALDETGLLLENGHPLAHYMHKVNGQPAITLGRGGPVLTQQDVRQVQLAKAAVCAGIKALLSHSGLEETAIQTLYIAGGFGSYLNLESAGQIGLIPKALLPKAKVVGNAALSGAAALLLDKSLLDTAKTLASSITALELSTSPQFMDAYIDCMEFAPC